jgi:tRNA dimethylallyltransferase
MGKVIVVVGPTAVGKTKVSIELAKRLGCDIISGDSVAVYKGLDIGSAKPTVSERDGVVHHLIDVKEPYEQYNVAEFQKEARKIMDANSLSLICGGTGLYIQSALFNYEFNAPKRDFDFEKRFTNYSNEELYNLLKSKDPTISEDRIHPNNRKRVLRALEIIETQNTSINDFNQKDVPLYDYYICYLSLPREELYERINKRVDIMLNEGLLDEVKGLYDQKIYPHAIGYQEFIPYFEGLVSIETAIDEVKKNSRHLAKRQETWFKNQMKSHFYNVNLANIDMTIDEIYNDINNWLVK